MISPLRWSKTCKNKQKNNISEVVEMKKIIAGLMVAAAMLTFGCSGRNAAFGVVDMRKVETEAQVIKTTKEEVEEFMKVFDLTYKEIYHGEV